MTDYSLLQVERIDSVERIALHNPTRRNAIGPRMIGELLLALEAAMTDEAVHSVVLTGSGDRAFCAGGDFSQMTGGADEGPRGDYVDLILAMTRAPKPIVARVNGHAMGGGLGLVAASHFAIAVKGAKLGTPEIDVGLFPMMIMAVLRRVMPRRRLMRMMLLGERLTAEQALEVGLVGEIAADHEALDAAVAKLTGELSKKSPIALRIGLEAIAAQDDLPLEEALPLLRERLAACLATDDAREGLMAFLEKRPPRWTGR